MNPGEYVCGHCGQTIAVAGDHVGQSVQCPHCQQLVVTAAGDAPAAVVTPTPSAAPARAKGRGRLAPLLLVFLIPYALVTTAVIAWLLWQQPRNNAHPLEWLLDQHPEDGGPKQIKHDLPLSDQQKTRLDKPIRIGDAVELTPVHVELAPGGDLLTLTLHVRNISKDLRFNPLPQAFLVPQQGYTFLEFGKQRIYGGKLSYRRPLGFWAGLGQRGQRAARDFDGVLDPGEAMTVTLSTTPRDEAKLLRLADYKGLITWRLEVRRGLVEVRGRLVSATAVVGVQFDTGVVLRDQRDFAGRHRLPLLALRCPPPGNPYNNLQIAYCPKEHLHRNEVRPVRLPT